MLFRSNARLEFTSEGRLVLQLLGVQEITISISNASSEASFASILNSGNLVLYNADSRIIWQTFDYPTDTLLPDQLLRAGNELVSSISESNHSTGRHRLVMQNDGNLVMYPVATPNAPDYAYWDAVSNFLGDNATLTLSENGRIFMVNALMR